MRVATWNVEWASPTMQRSGEILRRLERHSPEVLCLTEAHAGLLARRGHTVCSQADYGYTTRAGRHKAVLWSREPWEQVDDVGDESLPPGRFVAGVTQTSLGPLTVVGIGIPWFGSRTEARRGVDRRRQWQDHEEYLAGLAPLLARAPATRLLVLGDFNQVIGAKGRAPAALQRALLEAFPPTMSIATSDVAFQGRRSIDHIALTHDLAVESLQVISNIHDGKSLTDHFGIVAEVSGRPSDNP